MIEKLYSDIGVKIKGWAIGIFIVEAIGAIITGIVLLADELIVPGLLTIFCGPIVALISTWLLYAFGQLVDDTHAIRNQDKIVSDISKNLQTIAQPMIEEANKKARCVAEEQAIRQAETIAKREAAVKRMEEEKAKCDSEKKEEPILSKREKTLSEKLEYALKFHTDDGMVNYLNGIEDETVRNILKFPQHLIREQIRKLLNEM